jgi:hypothetical protein
MVREKIKIELVFNTKQKEVELNQKGVRMVLEKIKIEFVKV